MNPGFVSLSTNVTGPQEGEKNVLLMADVKHGVCSHGILFNCRIMFMADVKHGVCSHGILFNCRIMFMADVKHGVCSHGILFNCRINVNCEITNGNMFNGQQCIKFRQITPDANSGQVNALWL
ncbi:hypothetical protein BsWGS_26721 [Bradybaena similaris]